MKTSKKEIHARKKIKKCTWYISSLMGQAKSKLFGFNILLEKDRDSDKLESTETEEPNNQTDRPYTDNAVIIQSILEYSIDLGTENYFASTELSKNHLLDKCSYYRKLVQKSSFNIGSRVEHINQRVSACLERLEYLELVNHKEDTAGNGETTRRYRFTKLGRMIGLLLLYKKNQWSDTNIYEKVYSQTFDFYDSLNNSHSKFLLVFLFRCYRYGRFTEIILSLLGLLENASDDKEEFLDKLEFLNPVYRDLQMWQIFKDSIEFLFHHNHNVYELFLFNLKLTIEQTQESKSRNLKGFEKLRLDRFQEIDEVVVEGYCGSCKKFTPASMKTLHYLESYITAAVSEENAPRFECICNDGNLDFERVV